jgi:hypothetical protein
MSVLEDWTAAVCRELGLTGIGEGRATVDVVLDLARDVAHSVARPAAPLTAYLLGVAVGQAGDPGAAARLAARVAQLAVDWSPAPAGSAGIPATETPAVASRDQEAP